MNQDIKAEWVKRLRDPNARQTMDRLGMQDGRRCCLGVLCDIAVEEGVIRVWNTPMTEDSLDSLTYGNGMDKDSALLPSAVRDWAELHSNTPEVLRVGVDRVSLAQLNDMGVSFGKIADLIEEQL